LGEKFAKSWHVIIISAIKSYSNNMLVSLAANSDLRRQGPGMHHRDTEYTENIVFLIYP